jgi:DNA-binding CsgD family transcriptional regulator
MGKDDLDRLLRIQRKIVEASNRYYEDKPVIDKGNIVDINNVLRYAEMFFPDQIIMIYGGFSERIYFSSNVASAMSYSQAVLLNMPDYEFLSQIHPDDICEVCECMNEVFELYCDPFYDHPNTRYSFNVRFRKGTGEYAHIMYQAITIVYQGHFADIALIRDISHDASFAGVELVIEKRIENQFIELSRRKFEQTEPLTARENQLIKLIQEGHTNKQIATTLGITQSTVKNHKQNIYKKFSVKSRLQLMRFLKRDDDTISK